MKKCRTSIALLVSLTACLLSQPMHAAPLSYTDAIAKAVTSPSSDRRNELHRCVRNWQAYDDARRNFAEHLDKSGVLRSKRFVIFEIGNSGFPRFESGIVQNSILHINPEGSGPRSVDIRGSALEKLFSRLTEQDVSKMQGQAYSEMDDGDCYFVTVGVDSALKHAAIYGKPSRSTMAGQLATAILRNMKQGMRKK